jgi:uncharacterized protein with HEPN domain
MAASKSPRLRLLHMRDEIENLSKEMVGLSFDKYRQSYGLRRITERAIQIISEAASALPEDLRQRYPEAPWADIVAIGNPLRHEYHRIDDKVLWETATVDLPKLKPIIQRMLAELER